MIPPKWQLDTPLSTVIFDCDGTLSTIEGIDVLAEHNGMGQEVCDLTQEAMTRSGMNPELYRKRLELVNPTEEQVVALGKEYYANRVEDVEQVIQILKRLNKALFILSAGVYPAVKEFGKLLEIAEDNVIAVHLQFNERGNYAGYDHHSPLGYTNGKRAIMAELNKTQPAIAFVGDGLNDIEAKELVQRFIGYGGKFYRQVMSDRSDYYIRSVSFSPVLPLVLTLEESQQLLAPEKILYDKGIELINAGFVKVP
jgi:phosphoserine phosphatase